MRDYDPTRFKLKWTKAYRNLTSATLLGNFFSSLFTSKTEDLHLDLRLYGCFPNRDAIKDFWSSADGAVARFVRSVSLKNIGTSQYFHLKCCMMRNMMVVENPKKVYKLNKQLINSYRTHNKTIFEENELVPPDVLSYETNELEDRFGMLLLHPENIDIKKLLKEYHSDPATARDTISEEIRESFKTIIVHIHGGGFIASSTGHYELYTRRLSIETGCPIFSIDYRLAPEAKYPHSTHDCIKGYYWALEFCKHVLGVEVE